MYFYASEPRKVTSSAGLLAVCPVYCVNFFGRLFDEAGQAFEVFTIIAPQARRVNPQVESGDNSQNEAFRLIFSFMAPLTGSSATIAR